MKGLIQSLRRLLGVRSKEPTERTHGILDLVERSSDSQRQSAPQDTQEVEPSVDDLCEPTNDTVPNLRILKDPKGSESTGYNPYETSEDLRWNTDKDDT